MMNKLFNIIMKIFMLVKKILCYVLAGLVVIGCILINIPALAHAGIAICDMKLYSYKCKLWFEWDCFLSWLIHVWYELKIYRLRYCLRYRIIKRKFVRLYKNRRA